MKIVFTLILRTIIASLICLAMFLISGKLFNVLPAIIFIPVVLIYYLTALLWYFAIASDDILSTILGIIFSLMFIYLYFIDLTFAETIFMKGVYIVGIILGLMQTLHSVQLRFNRV